MKKYSFVTRMPNRPGALHQAAEISKRYEANINRIHFDRRIDPQTVFFEVTATNGTYGSILRELGAIGYLQTSIPTLSFLKCHVHLPHRAGALFEFLNFTTEAKANIAYIDFDDSGRQPDRVTVSLSVRESDAADDLLNQLKSRYPLEIVEYDTTGKQLDDTVFYIRFAQQLRPLIGDTEEKFLLSFLGDINHIVQELAHRGKDPREVFDRVLQAGQILNSTTGEDFYADVQRIRLTGNTTLYCFQLPGGGNVFVFETPEEEVMVDTGYGIYHHDVMQMFSRYGLGSRDKLRRIITTHGDADHCGGAGWFEVPCYMHPETLEIIRRANRAYGSRNEDSVLEEVYTTMIALFSRFHTPRNIRLFPAEGDLSRSIFPVLATITIGDLGFEILGSVGGHQVGQIFLLCPSHGLLFTGDSLMNFNSFTEARRKYNSLADYLITSVNVDSDLARKERRALVTLTEEIDRALAPRGGRCIVCGGHGAASVIEDGKLRNAGEIEHYTPGTEAETRPKDKETI